MLTEIETPIEEKKMINPILFVQLTYLCGIYLTKHFKIRVGDFHEYISKGVSVSVEEVIQFLDEMVEIGFLDMHKGNEHSPVNIVYKRFVPNP